ncbi:MAG: class I SAM-dependent methyltransferase [bacterium]|nr:class I SAM-dependent methyltransferase [bacterium]
MEQRTHDTPWDKFAKEDPMFYITTRRKKRWREEDAFWQSGEVTAQFIWDLVAPHITSYELAIELGCGIGRLAVPMAKKFNRLKVVDISPHMLQKLRERCESFGVGNLSCCLPTDPWWEEPADFIYSALMFQHLERFEEIEEYVQRIAQCLRGAAFLQCDTRPRNWFVAARRMVPDALLPRTQRRGMRRHRRDPDAIRALLHMVGLRIVAERDPGTELHVFIVTQRPPPLTPSSLRTTTDADEREGEDQT